MLPVALHTRVRQEQEKAGMTLGEYVEAMITEYYDWKDGKIMTGEMRTLAAQIPAELFDRLDRYLKERGIKKKDFLVDIITRALEGCVKIVPLLEGGGIPDAAMLTKVLDVVNAKDIRPLTDKVSAVPPEVETYDIEIVYYTTPKNEAEVIANVEGTGGAIDRYNEWQVAALGRDINPDQLRKRILSPSWGENLTGAFRVDVVKPT